MSICQRSFDASFQCRICTIFSPSSLSGTTIIVYGLDYYITRLLDFPFCTLLHGVIGNNGGGICNYGNNAQNKRSFNLSLSLILSLLPINYLFFRVYMCTCEITKQPIRLQNYTKVSTYTNIFCIFLSKK